MSMSPGEYPPGGNTLSHGHGITPLQTNYGATGRFINNSSSSSNESVINLLQRMALQMDRMEAQLQQQLQQQEYMAWQLHRMEQQLHKDQQQ